MQKQKTKQLEDKTYGEHKKIQCKENWCHQVEDPIIGQKNLHGNKVNAPKWRNKPRDYRLYCNPRKNDYEWHVDIPWLHYWPSKIKEKIVRHFGWESKSLSRRQKKIRLFYTNIHCPNIIK